MSVWVTSNPRPVLITQALVSKAISDLAWTPDGKTLFVTCIDGTILALEFAHGELGYEASTEEVEKSLAKFGAGRRGIGIIEGTGSLVLENMSREGELRGVEGRMGALMGDVSSTTATATNGTMALPTNGVSNGLVGAENQLQNGTKVGQSTEGTNGGPRLPEDLHTKKLESLKSRITITKDGKKRIAPLLVSSSGGQESSLPKAKLMASTAGGQNAEDQPQGILDLSKPFDGLPKGGLASLLLGNRRRLATIEGDEDDQVEKRVALARKDGAIPILENTPEGLLPARPSHPPIQQQNTPEFLRPAVTNPSMMLSMLRLAVPKVRSHIVRSLGDKAPLQPSGAANAQAGQQVETVIETRNPSHVAAGRPQDQEPCRVTVTQRGVPIWQDFLPRCALLVTGNRSFWAVACEDGSLQAWTPAGRRLINAMVLESQPVILDCLDRWLLCITAAGMCYVWDMKSLRSPHPPVSLAPILDIAVHNLQSYATTGPAVTSARLNSEGRIVVTLNNGDGYAYSPSMFAWQRLSEIFWAVGSQYWNTTDSSVGDLASSKQNDRANDSTTSSGVIPFLERGTTREMLLRGRAYALSRMIKQLLSREGFEGLESSVSVAHLENRLAAAMMLGAKDDFQIYLYMYAKRLGSESLKTKVEELLQGLLGGVEEEITRDEGTLPLSNANASDRNMESEGEILCGWPRRELLRNVILILGNASFQYSAMDRQLTSI